jgi:hypothetical protein
VIALLDAATAVVEAAASDALDDGFWALLPPIAGVDPRAVALISAVLGVGAAILFWKRPSRVRRAKGLVALAWTIGLTCLVIFGGQTARTTLTIGVQWSLMLGPGYLSLWAMHVVLDFIVDEQAMVMAETRAEAERLARRAALDALREYLPPPAPSA